MIVKKPTREMILDEAKFSAMWRFVRVIVPQLPGILAYALNESKLTNFPPVLMPTLIFAGAIVTALDKLIRDLQNME